MNCITQTTNHQSITKIEIICCNRIKMEFFLRHNFTKFPVKFNKNRCELLKFANKLQTNHLMTQRKHIRVREVSKLCELSKLCFSWRTFWAEEQEVQFFTWFIEFCNSFRFLINNCKFEELLWFGWYKQLSKRLFLSNKLDWCLFFVKAMIGYSLMSGL